MRIGGIRAVEGNAYACRVFQLVDMEPIAMVWLYETGYTYNGSLNRVANISTLGNLSI